MKSVAIAVMMIASSLFAKEIVKSYSQISLTNNVDTFNKSAMVVINFGNTKNTSIISIDGQELVVTHHKNIGDTVFSGINFKRFSSSDMLSTNSILWVAYDYSVVMYEYVGEEMYIFYNNGD